MNRDKIVADTTADITRWWESLPLTRGPMERYCLWWSKFVVMNLRKIGVNAFINAGSASWVIIKDEEDDGIILNNYGYKFTWNQLALDQIQNASLPEMHVWVIIPPENCPEGRGQLIDLTTQFVLDQAKKVLPHANIEYPILWCYFDELPDGIFYHANRQATELATALLICENTHVLSFKVFEPMQ